MARVIKTVTENYTVLDGDDGGIIIGNSSSPIAITMPSSIGRATFSLTVMNANGGEVTVLSQTIGQNEEISIANSNDTWTYALGGGAEISELSFYVNPSSGNDNNDGLSAETAFATIEKVVELLENGPAGNDYTYVKWLTIYLSAGADFSSSAITLATSFGEWVSITKYGSGSNPLFSELAIIDSETRISKTKNVSILNIDCSVKMDVALNQIQLYIFDLETPTLLIDSDISGVRVEYSDITDHIWIEGINSLVFLNTCSLHDLTSSILVSLIKDGCTITGTETIS